MIFVTNACHSELASLTRGAPSEQLASELHASFGVEANVCVADLTDDEECKKVAKLLEASETPELLVNNAGVATFGDFFSLDVDSHERMHRLHVLATMRLSHASLKQMVSKNRGGLINVSSVAAFWHSPGATSYCATKSWMNSFAVGLYLDLKRTGSSVAVQALCPGFTRTEIFDGMREQLDYIRSSL